MEPRHVWKGGSKPPAYGKIRCADMHACSVRVMRRVYASPILFCGLNLELPDCSALCVRSFHQIMFVMRFTVIDQQGTTSFVAPCTALKALVAACASSPPPEGTEGLLAATEPFDSELRDYVLNGLA